MYANPAARCLPTLLTQSAFNRRLPRLWEAFILIQDAVAEVLTDAGAYDIMDGFPLPVAHGAPTRRMDGRVAQWWCGIAQASLER